MWKEMQEERDWMRDDFQRDDDSHKAQNIYDEGYEDGYKAGYRKAMKEAHSESHRDGYGERIDGDSGGYHRRGDDYGERRGVPGTGPYSRRR